MEPEQARFIAVDTHKDEIQAESRPNAWTFFLVVEKRLDLLGDKR
jgi:hypothetical protein